MISAVGGTLHLRAGMLLVSEEEDGGMWDLRDQGLGMQEGVRALSSGRARLVLFEGPDAQEAAALFAMLFVSPICKGGA